MTALDHLLALRELLGAREDAWLPGFAFRTLNDRGGDCRPQADVACRWGLFAAMQRVGGGDVVIIVATQHLRRATGVMFVPRWEETPGRTRAELLDAIDRAIGFARAEPRP